MLNKRTNEELFVMHLSRNTCLCLKHQNMALKPKGLRSYGIDISPNPETARKKTTAEKLRQRLDNIEDGMLSYEVWKSVEIDGKKKMRVIKVEMTKSDYITKMTNQF